MGTQLRVLAVSNGPNVPPGLASHVDGRPINWQATLVNGVRQVAVSSRVIGTLSRHTSSTR